MLLTTMQGTHALLDAFHGTVEAVFSGHANAQGLPLEACFTPDSEWVLAGGEDGGISRWEVAKHLGGQTPAKQLPVLREE